MRCHQEPPTPAAQWRRHKRSYRKQKDCCGAERAAQEEGGGGADQCRTPRSETGSNPGGAAPPVSLILFAQKAVGKNARYNIGIICRSMIMNRKYYGPPVFERPPAATERYTNHQVRTPVQSKSSLSPVFFIPMGRVRKKGSQQRMNIPTTTPRVLAAFFSRLNLSSLTDSVLLPVAPPLRLLAPASWVLQ
uniref:Uncharacterized protein n=1 Tax=Neogobius melanostomus TaxID=47308 RepID=A0A8C6SY35_9GOBI